MKPNARKRILVIAGYSRSLINFRGELLRAMCASGHHVIAAAPDLNLDEPAVSQLRGMGVVCRDIPLYRTGRNALADARLLGSLIRLMRAERPSVVLAYTAKPVIFGLIAAAIARVPWRFALITGLGYAFADLTDRKSALIRTIQERLYRLALKRATKVFFQNQDDPDLFRRLRIVPRGLRVVVVNGSGIDLGHFRSTPIPEGPLRFLLIARLLAAKGIREYAKAAEIIRKRHPDVQFHLIGGLDTNPDALAREELQQWQNSGTLTWHGEVADVRPHIAACHVYVLPSYYREGTPRSILEALSIGRAIITTDAPGCRETVVEGENGFLVPPRDSRRLAGAIEQFIDNQGLIVSMGSHSRELAERRYDVNKVNAHMLSEMELA